MKFLNGVPKWLGWIFKAVIYGLALLVILILLFFWAGKRLADNVETCEAQSGIRNNNQKSVLQNTQAFVACMQKENGMLENWIMRDTSATIAGLPNAPCKYVGVWESVRPQCRYTITLMENGIFKAAPIACNLSMSAYSGTWGVYENKMAWLDSRDFRWPIDINPIVAEEANSFALIEVNGTRTQFNRIEQPSPATGCVKPAAASAAKQSPVAQSPAAPAPAAIALPAAASAPVVAPVVPAPAVAAVVPGAVMVEAVPVVTTVKHGPAGKKARHPRRGPTDLRYCLELSGNYEIAKCATKDR